MQFLYKIGYHKFVNNNLRLEFYDKLLKARKTSNYLEGLLESIKIANVISYTYLKIV